MFWIIASLVLVAAALVTFMPLLRGKTYWQPVAVALVFLLPAAGLLLYQQVGTPQAMEVAAAPHAAVASADAGPDIESAIEKLRGKLTESPEDIEGWMLLGRTLKTMQRYPEALDALQVAGRIAPDNPLVMVELAEAQIYASQAGQIGPETHALLERALELDPAQQKGLWLLGIASAHAGDFATAVNHWRRLLALLEPGSSVAQSVQAQIDQANARMGIVPAMFPAAERAAQAAASDGADGATGAAGDAWQGTAVHIAASDSARSAIPTGGVLFVIIRSAGMAAGPPLGVRRINDPVLPLDITVTDRDSMLAERRISLESEVQLQARISLSGSPAAASGDWQSAPVVVSLGETGAVELVIDHRIE